MTVQTHQLDRVTRIRRKSLIGKKRTVSGVECRIADCDNHYQLEARSVAKNELVGYISPDQLHLYI